MSDPSPLAQGWKDRDGGEVLDALPDAVGSDPSLNVYELLDELGLGDGLPVLNPTAAALEAMFAELSRAPDEVVATIPPLRGSLTVRRLAVCAVLAGCRPAHLPLLAAAVTGLAEEELNAYGVLTTTGNAAMMMVVNGPAVARLGLNAGSNCLGPGNRSNATLGRCLSLVTRIVGGAREDYADMATMGQPAKYGFCFGENEAASSWEPLHCERGFAADTSTVTLIGISGSFEVFEMDSYDPDEMIDSLAPSLAGCAPMNPAPGNLVGGGQPVVVLSPEWSQHFSQSGLTKADVKQQLFERAVRANDRESRVAREWKDILVVVAGGYGIKQTVVPNWNGGSRAVTIPF